MRRTMRLSLAVSFLAHNVINPIRVSRHDTNIVPVDIAVLDLGFELKPVEYVFRVFLLRPIR